VRADLAQPSLTGGVAQVVADHGGGVEGLPEFASLGAPRR
jgi:hypothetical protein